MYRLNHRPSFFAANGLAGSLNQVTDFVLESLDKLPHRIRRLWQEALEVRSLEQLDDRLLHDIGIPRGSIPTVVKAAYDAAEAKRQAAPGNADPVRVSLSDLNLRPCVNC